jgi:hypothetical protein
VVKQDCHLPRSTRRKDVEPTLNRYVIVRDSSMNAVALGTPCTESTFN